MRIPLLEAPFPLPEGTPIFDADGVMVARLGPSVPAQDPEFQFTAVVLSVPLLWDGDQA